MNIRNISGIITIFILSLCCHL